MSKFSICTLSEWKTISVLEHQKVTKDSFSVIAVLLEMLQAFCGPVATIAIGCVAVAGFVQAAAPHILALFGIQPLASLVSLQEAVPTRVNNFTTASLLLSIGIPLLKFQHKPLYVQHSLSLHFSHLS
jgi:hypothetical protein